MLGTCCAIVLSDAADPVLALHNLMRFYRHESCGQCTPCREGMRLDRADPGQDRRRPGLDGRARSAHEIAANIMGNTICAFGDGAAMPALGFVRKFRRNFEDYVLARRERPDPHSCAMSAANLWFFVLRAARSVGALSVLCPQPHPVRDGAARHHPRHRRPVPEAARRVPRGHPAHRLRGRGRGPLRVRDHAARTRTPAESPHESPVAPGPCLGGAMALRQRRARPGDARRPGAADRLRLGPLPPGHGSVEALGGALFPRVGALRARAPPS